MILIPGAPLLSIALNANVLATVLLPVSLVLMVMLANDKGLMGPWVNKRSTNVDRDRGDRVRRALRRRLRHRLVPAGDHLIGCMSNETLAPGPSDVAIRERDLQRQERLEDELIMHLERDQFVAETSGPCRARRSAHAPAPGCGRCACSS